MNIRHTRRQFIAFGSKYGVGPWLCDFCKEEIDPDAEPRSSDCLVVHHLNRDKSNNTPENLVPAHNSCHARHHLKDKKWSQARRQAERTRGPNKSRKSGLPLRKVIHGTTTNYYNGCRCDECRAANARYMKDYRKRLLA